MTEEGEKTYHSVRGIFENDIYEKAIDVALNFKKMALRWPTAQELSDRIGLEIDQKIRSILVDELGWREPDKEEIEDSKEEIGKILRIIVVEDLEWPHNPYLEKPGHPTEEFKINKYRNDNADLLEEIEIKEEPQTGEDYFIIEANLEELVELPNQLKNILEKDFIAVRG